MNPRQKVVIWVGVLLIVAMGLYPPWTCGGGRGISAAIGYHWLFVSPVKECFAANVDLPRLLIQWAIVGMLAAAICWAWPFFPLPSWAPRVIPHVKRVLHIILALGIAALGVCALYYFALAMHWLGDLPVMKAAEKRIHGGMESDWAIRVGIAGVIALLVGVFVKNVVKGYRGR